MTVALKHRFRKKSTRLIQQSNSSERLLRFYPQKLRVKLQTFLRTSSSSSVRTLQASLSSGLVRGEGCRPSGLWLHSSSDFWPLTMPWEWPEEADRWGLLDPTPARGHAATEVRGENDKVSDSNKHNREPDLGHNIYMSLLRWVEFGKLWEFIWRQGCNKS